MPETPGTIKLRYVGSRFDGGKLPTDVLSDLPAFRDLLTAFARESWLHENRDRQRVPKGFERSITFNLVGLTDGSAVPCLEWDRDTAQATLPGFTSSLEALVAKSYHLVVDLIDGAGSGMYPASLSPGHIRALDKFGSGLREGERIEFSGTSGDDGNVVYLDSRRRKNLITQVKETYYAQYESTGRLVGNQENGYIVVSTEQHGDLTVNVGAELVKKNFDGSLGSNVQFNLTIELDHNDRFRSIVDVNYIDIFDDQAVTEYERCVTRLSELAGMKDGWQDGEGSEISDRALDNAKLFLDRRPGLSSLFRIYPTTEGGVMFEFESDGWDYSVEFNGDSSVEMYGVEIDGNEEMSPRNFDALDEEFKAEFDARVER